MKKGNTSRIIEQNFRKQVQKDARLHNAYLLVHSEKANVDLRIAEGCTGEMPAHPDQPNYMASLGKLLTSTIAAILFEKGQLDFQDSAAKYLDEDLMRNLSVHKGRDHSGDIQIRHLLNQTSGLPDNFWPLLEQLLENPNFEMTPQQAITWVKEHAKPKGPPGKKFNYTDTNYHLLGLIIENITGRPFHEVLHQFIFEPLEMKHSWMLHYSEPMETPEYPMADFYVKGKLKMNDRPGYAGLDYTGGGVVAPMDDLLNFMKALVGNQIITEPTLTTMKADRATLGPGMKYGYGIWQFVPLFPVMPKKYSSWGVAGATGAFMFYHPATESYIIGNFNDTLYQRKGLRFMLSKIINPLVKSVKT